MDKKITIEIHGYAQQIVKNTFGSQAEIKGFEWAAGGLYCKVFKINTTYGDFILKMECDKIFFAIRKDQIENDVIGHSIFQKAGIPCADILAYDFTKKDIGVKYVLMEYINDTHFFDDGNVRRSFDEMTKEEIYRQYKMIIEKLRTITNSHFGSLSQSGMLAGIKPMTTIIIRH